MNIEDIRAYCLSKKATTDGFPFDEVTLVFKVHNKMFALTNLDGDLSINLKCDPERAIVLREEHPEIIPGWHMNKKHWNTIDLQGILSDAYIEELIDHSYDLVYGSLPKKIRDSD
ncbi:MAG: MmcQ/YjbR family DNA-binding protein [Bacteroidales bacterium]|nr:MmcQ/YjbR family DNA-binding protein [Bacteroidales bacterium]